MPEAIRTKTGAAGLDRILGGGLPVPSTTLLLGEAGTGKSTLATQFVATGLMAGERAVVAISGFPPSEFAGSLKKIWPGAATRLKDVSFIDLYAWRNPFGEKAPNAYKVASPSDLNEFNKALQDALRGGSARVVVDSVSDMLLFADAQSVFKLMQLVAAKVRASNSTAVITLEKGMHKEADQGTIEYIANNVIEMKLEAAERSLRVKKMQTAQHPLNWFGYSISGGIVVKA